jgi:hypothetical protein
VTVERIFKFLRKSLDTQSFSQKLFVQIDNFVTQVINLTSLRTDNSEFAFKIGNRIVENSDILKSLLVLVLTFAKSSLQNFDLLVKEGKFIISTNKLSSKNISLVDYFGDFLLFDFMFIVSFFYNESQLFLLHF